MTNGLSISVAQRLPAPRGRALIAVFRWGDLRQKLKRHSRSVFFKGSKGFILNHRSKICDKLEARTSTSPSIAWGSAKSS
jgi:hypothetical protein